MNNFDWTSFTKMIAIKAPLYDIYNAWTKGGELEEVVSQTSDIY